MPKVIIIEDDGSLQQLLAETLFKDGYDVHYAFNGKEGYEKCLALDPDLILLDLMLPVFNGAEVLKRLSANNLLKDIPVIVMTGHGGRNEILDDLIKGGAALKYQGYGVREYIRKPFELHEMAALVNKVLTQVQPRREKAEVVEKGVVRLDLRFRTVWVSSKLVATISRKRVELLKILMRVKGGVKREKLMTEIWGVTGKVAALEKTIERLRKDLGGEARRLQTTLEGYELVG